MKSTTGNGFIFCNNPLFSTYFLLWSKNLKMQVVKMNLFNLQLPSSGNSSTEKWQTFFISSATLRNTNYSTTLTVDLSVKRNVGFVSARMELNLWARYSVSLLSRIEIPPILQGLALFPHFHKVLFALLWLLRVYTFSDISRFIEMVTLSYTLGPMSSGTDLYEMYLSLFSLIR